MCPVITGLFWSRSWSLQRTLVQCPAHLHSLMVYLWSHCWPLEWIRPRAGLSSPLMLCMISTTSAWMRWQMDADCYHSSGNWTIRFAVPICMWLIGAIEIRFWFNVIVYCHISKLCCCRTTQNNVDPKTKFWISKCCETRDSQLYCMGCHLKLVFFALLNFVLKCRSAVSKDFQVMYLCMVCGDVLNSDLMTLNWPWKPFFGFVV